MPESHKRVARFGKNRRVGEGMLLSRTKLYTEHFTKSHSEGQMQYGVGNSRKENRLCYLLVCGIHDF